MNPMQRFPTPPPPSPEPPEESHEHEYSTPLGLNGNAIGPIGPPAPRRRVPQVILQHPKRDLVKWAVLLAIIAIVVGFFIGKSMNPVHIHLGN